MLDELRKIRYARFRLEMTTVGKLQYPPTGTRSLEAV